MRPFYVLKAFLLNFWFVISQSLWIFKSKSILRFDFRFNKMICYLNPSSFEIHKRIKNNSLWFKARKHFTFKNEQIRNQVNWFWISFIWGWGSLYLHLIKILLSSRSYFGPEIQRSNRYVEFWMYSCRTLHRISAISRRIWRRLTCLNYGGSWKAFKRSYEYC